MDRALDFLASHMWLSQIGGIICGFFFLGEEPLFGLALIAVSGLSFFLTTFITPWHEMTFGQRALVVPGVIAGYIIVGFAIILLFVAGNALREEMSKP